MGRKVNQADLMSEVRDIEEAEFDAKLPQQLDFDADMEGMVTFEMAGIDPWDI